MPISLSKPSGFRYIRNASVTNHVHLRASLIEGTEEISTANTCRADEQRRAFFGGGAIGELERYKQILEIHILLLKEGDAQRQAKEARLAQINRYLAALIGMRNNYEQVVDRFRSQPSNIYSIQLRPIAQDSLSKVVKPVFTMNRSNNSRGTPLSALFNAMHQVFPKLNLEKTDLATQVLQLLPPNPTFHDIKQTLKQKCEERFKLWGIDTELESQDYDTGFENYFRHKNPPQDVVLDKQHVDAYMGFNHHTTPEEYIDALLNIWICARNNIWMLAAGSPFYLETVADETMKAERLSILTQFYLGVMTASCHINGRSQANFGVILDNDLDLSLELVEQVAEALVHGGNVEQAFFTFFDAHWQRFELSQPLTQADQEDIVTLFNTTYRSVSATKENVHRDDYLIRDTKARGENAPVEYHDGMMCTDLANLIPFADLNLNASDQAYFYEIRQEACQHSALISPKDEPVVTVDIELGALMAKMEERPDLPWKEVLPEGTYNACRTLPAFAAREFLDAVAKGKQDEANAMLEASEDKQALLTAPAHFTDYSGRTYNCTAYEKAWWDKDTHMCRMLESHMDNETKQQLLDKIGEIERKGLAYQQHGVEYKNAHYDMSFILKNLTLDEFRHLKALLVQSHDKLNTATQDNYKTISFTATEYEQLKKELAQQKVRSLMPVCFASFQFLSYITYPIFFIASFFITSPAEKLSNQLQFDFHSLITALDTYVTNFDKWDYHQREEAWMKVGKAQRDVPVHVAHEYCRPDRAFDPLPSFTEEALPRVLTFYNYVTNIKSWFPLSPSSGLGFDFALTRGHDGTRSLPGRGAHWEAGGGLRLMARLDLVAVHHLDEVRIADLTQSRENLSRPASQLGLVY